MTLRERSPKPGLGRNFMAQDEGSVPDLRNYNPLRLVWLQLLMKCVVSTFSLMMNVVLIACLVSLSYGLSWILFCLFSAFCTYAFNFGVLFSCICLFQSYLCATETVVYCRLFSSRPI